MGVPNPIDPTSLAPHIEVLGAGVVLILSARASLLGISVLSGHSNEAEIESVSDGKTRHGYPWLKAYHTHGAYLDQLQPQPLASVEEDPPTYRVSQQSRNIQQSLVRLLRLHPLVV